MKKIIALSGLWLLITQVAIAGEPNEADKKWLEVVQKKIVEGQTRISTPIDERVTLLKDWASKNGYTVSVTQSEHGFRVALAKNVARN